MATQWYYQLTDRVLGPVSTQELAELARNGQLLPDHLVRSVESDRWIEASRVTGLNLDASQSSSPLPPPPMHPSRTHRPEQSNAGFSKHSLAIGCGVATVLGVMGLLLLFFLLLVVTSGNSGDVVAQQTKHAWDQTQQIDVQLRPLIHNAPASYWEQQYVQYLLVGTDYVDEDLAKLIRDWIAVSMEMDTLLKTFVDEAQRLGHEAEAMAALGAKIGRLDSSDPQRGAAAGAIVFGSLAEASRQDRMRELGHRFDVEYDACSVRAVQIQIRRYELAATLTSRYGVPYEYKFYGGGSQQQNSALPVMQTPAPVEKRANESGDNAGNPYAGSGGRDQFLKDMRTLTGE